jgi:hypothetical protein
MNDYQNTLDAILDAIFDNLLADDDNLDSKASLDFLVPLLEKNNLFLD